jgi:UDPglucose 6-dehydrogenase
MRIAVVGSGYVGLVTGTCLADTGNTVVGLDVDPRKVERLRRGESPIYEPGLEEMLDRNLRAGRLSFTLDRALAYDHAEIIFLCVGTPSDKLGRADLQYVLGAAADIGDALDRAPMTERPPIVVVKSTVPVGTNDKVKETISARTGRPFLMASNPEFLKEGAAIADFVRPDRIVIGADNEHAGQRLRDLYEPFVRQGNPILVMPIRSAEMVKYASNAMLATKISFINEIAALCEVWGAEIEDVRRGMCADRRIGNQFLYPGLGYGGSCFPKDVLACLAMGEARGTPTHLLSAVHLVNQRQRDRFVQKIEAQYGKDLSGLRFAVWGVAFKPETDDTREAPSLDIMRAILARGGAVVAYDPVADDVARGDLGAGATSVATALEATQGADALLLCTEWSEFRQPDWEAVLTRMRGRVVFDGRNIWRPEQMARLGFRYWSVGRAPVDASIG